MTSYSINVFDGKMEIDYKRFAEMIYLAGETNDKPNLFFIVNPIHASGLKEAGLVADRDFIISGKVEMQNVIVCNMKENLPCLKMVNDLFGEHEPKEGAIRMNREQRRKRDRELQKLNNDGEKYAKNKN